MYGSLYRFPHLLKTILLELQLHDDTLPIYFYFLVPLVSEARQFLMPPR